MAENLEPLGERVIIRPIEQEERTKSGIILPDTAKEKPQEGEVIAVGPGKVLKDGTKAPMEVKAGDRVIFARFAGTEVRVGDEKLLIMSQGDIMAIKAVRSSRSRRKPKEK